MNSDEQVMVNLNSAGIDELTQLPGIGPDIARRIINGRPYESIDELTRISGIGPVLFELLQGARREKEAHVLQDALSVLPFVEIDRSLWLESGHLSSALRRKGITLPMTDCVIAASAKKEGCLVYTLDHHFDHFPDLLFRNPPV